MFSFLKKSSPSPTSLRFPIGRDMHSHILPGIDDGSPDLETSLALVRGMMSLGIKEATATPHIISDMYRNTPETINNALVLLQNAIAAEGLDFKVSAAAEYMLDNYFFELLAAPEPMLTIKDNIILTEFSYSAMPSNPEKMSFTIITEGYTPILAHPERYAYYHNNYNFYHQLRELGFLLQVNLLSLTGYYGKETTKAAKYLVKHDLVTYAGTDMHHVRHLAALSDPKCWKMFEELFEGIELEN